MPHIIIGSMAVILLRVAWLLLLCVIGYVVLVSVSLCFRIYEVLPEVTDKKRMYITEREKTANRLKAKLFNQVKLDVLRKQL